ncbi:MAG TPA: hypothetical protein VFV46_07975 [Lacibacter sp.]|nr:hypothetical protein [Lacibacter sp.]
MKNLLLLFIVGAGVVGMAGCGNNCRDVNCQSVPPAFFGFRLVNGSGKDLLTGAFKQYDSSQLRIRAKQKNTAALTTIDRFFSYSGDTSAYAAFTVTDQFDVYYLQLNGAVTDSFYFNYTRNATDCCDLSYFSFNRVNTTSITPIRLPGSYVLQK